MFYQDGWVPLCDVAAEVRRRNDEALDITSEDASRDPSLRLQVWEAYSGAILSIWEILDNASEIAVLLPNGVVAKASRQLVEWDGTDRLSNSHLQIFIGTVGSAIPEAADEEVGKDLANIRYGPFLGLPILLPQECWEIAAGLRDASYAPPDQNTRITYVEVARQIIAAHDADKGLRKSDLKEQLASTWSARRFERSWAIASQERPALSKPGRKPEGN